MSKAINKQQNNEEYLRYRYVSRLLYSQEKKYRALLTLGSIVIYILGFIPTISDLQFVLMLPVIWIMVSEFLKRKLLNIHKKAVDYHEYNDRMMFGLSKLITLIDNHSFLYQDAINITSKEKNKKAFDEMSKKKSNMSIKNWYNNFKGIPVDISIIMAQDENVNWERNQRKIYEIILIISIIIISSPIIIIYLSTNEVKYIMFTIPIIWHIVAMFLDNRNSLSKCNSIIENIGGVYGYIKNNGKKYDSNYLYEKSTEIQFKIYENRKDSIPVPDKIYYTFRSKLQKQSDLYMNSIKSDIKKRIR